MLAPAFENTAIQDISHLKGPYEINILNLQRISPERDNPRFQNNLGTEVSGTKDSWTKALAVSMKLSPMQKDSNIFGP